MRFGIHMPQKGGFELNLKRCLGFGCNTMQIFSGNPRSWKPPKLDMQVIEQRKQLLEESGVFPLVIHTAYLVNIASLHDDFFERSVFLLRDTMRRASLYGSPYVVLHTGNHGGAGREKGLEKLVTTLKSEMPLWPRGVSLLLENTAGGGNVLGADFEEIGAIFSALSGALPLGLCFDTAHAWAAGYDLSGAEGVEKTLTALDRAVGLHRLKVMHVNDSAFDRGSRKDRHAHIGEGYIGIDGFTALLRFSWPSDLPLILETPQMGTEHDQKNMEVLKKCATR